MIISNLVGVIADDLTGANDTALQFKNAMQKQKFYWITQLHQKTMKTLKYGQFLQSQEISVQVQPSSECLKQYQI